MRLTRKEAKAYFNNCTRKEYDALIVDAYLTARQIKIAALKKTEKMPTWEIANMLHVSPETISRELEAIYDKIARVIL